MKRDDWKLGNGISAGDDAWLIQEDGTLIFCHVLKARGWTIKGYESGNCLIDVDGELMAVVGSKLKSMEKDEITK